MYCPANPVSALIGDETPIRFVLSAILKVGIYFYECVDNVSYHSRGLSLTLEESDEHWRSQLNFVGLSLPL